MRLSGICIISLLNATQSTYQQNRLINQLHYFKTTRMASYIIQVENFELAESSRIYFGIKIMKEKPGILIQDHTSATNPFIKQTVNQNPQNAIQRFRNKPKSTMKILKKTLHFHLIKILP